MPSYILTKDKADQLRPDVSGCITVPLEMSTIENNAFAGRQDITTIRFHNLMKINREAFANSSVEQLFLFDTKNWLEVGAYAFANCMKLTDVYETKMPRISVGMFENCRNLSRVFLSSSTTHIAKDAFRNCVSLQEIHIPPSVISIAEDAFDGCPNVTIRTVSGSHAADFATRHSLSVTLYPSYSSVPQAERNHNDSLQSNQPTAVSDSTEKPIVTDEDLDSLLQEIRDMLADSPIPAEQRTPVQCQQPVIPYIPAQDDEIIELDDTVHTPQKVLAIPENEIIDLIRIFDKESKPLIPEIDDVVTSPLDHGIRLDESNISFVFISYSSENKSDAEALCCLLTSRKIPFWIAPRSVPEGGDFASEIYLALQNPSCKALILLLSEAAMHRTPWIPKELEIAIRFNRSMYCVPLDDTPETPDFAGRLINVQKGSMQDTVTRIVRDHFSQ